MKMKVTYGSLPCVAFLNVLNTFFLKKTADYEVLVRFKEYSIKTIFFSVGVGGKGCVRRESGSCLIVRQAQ